MMSYMGYVWGLLYDVDWFLFQDQKLRGHRRAYKDSGFRVQDQVYSGYTCSNGREQKRRVSNEP